ncbi:glycosyltransferase family 2 protein [Desulfonatronum parangueonense]
MPAYNTDKYISSAIDSILLQSFNNIELIVVNDGSTDRTLDIALSYEKRDERVKVFSQDNKGQGSARNYGIKKARGKYVYFMDSDDLLNSQTFSICLDHIHQNNLDMVSFSGNVLCEDKNQENRFVNYQKPDFLNPCLGKELLVNLYSQDAYSCQPCLYIFSRDLLTVMPKWFDEGFVHEDEGFTAELYCRAKRAISMSNRFFTRRIRLGSTMTSDHSWHNVLGKTQAVLRIESIISECRSIDPETRNILRLHQKGILRGARKLSETIGCQDDFISFVEEKFSTRTIWQIDPAMLLYNRMNFLYRTLRKTKQFLCKPRTTKNNHAI